MQEKQIAFIPQWISTTLGRNNLKKEDLLSFEKICRYFSTEDLVSLVVFGQLSEHFVRSGLYCDKTDFIYRWLSSTSDAKLKDLINDISALSVVEETKTEVFNRLCKPFEAEVSTTGLPGPVTYEVFLLGDFGVGVVLKQGFTAMEHAKNSSALLKELVKKLYVYEDYHKLMARSIGLAYVESLMH